MMSTSASLMDLLRTVPTRVITEEERRGRQPLPAGTRIMGDRYELREEIGCGSFGIIYTGTESRIGQTLAIKEFFPAGCVRDEHGPGLLPPEDWGETELQELEAQFKEEYRVLERFERPGIVKVYEMVEHNGGLFMVMELLRGATLDEMLQAHGRLDERQALYVLRRLGATLETIHLSGLVHGDIKPDNIFLTRQAEVILLDFGAVNHYLTENRKAPRFLTPGYAPPEQYQKHRIPEPATDLYALGATLYELLTGTPPPDAKERIKGARLPSPDSMGATVSVDLVSALAKTLALAREKRPASAHALMELLPAGDPEEERSSQPYIALSPWEGHLDTVRRLQLTSDGQFLASADKSGQLRLWSMPQERCMGVLEFGAEIIDTAIHPDDRWLAVALSGGRVELLDFSTGKTKGNIRTGSPPVSAVTFSPDGKRLLCGLSSGDIEVWNLHAKELIESFNCHDSPINDIVFNRTGRLMGLASNDRRVSIWDRKSKRRIRIFDEFRRPFQCVSFSPNGLFLLAGGSEMIMRLFDVRQGDIFRRFKGHEAMVWDLLFVEDLNYVISCSADKTVRLWDMASFREITRIYIGDGWLQTMAYDNRTATLCVAGVDKLIHRFRLRGRDVGF